MSYGEGQSTTDFMNWQEQAEIVLGVQRELLEELQQNKIQQNKPQASAQAPASGDREMLVQAEPVKVEQQEQEENTNPGYTGEEENN